MFRGTALALGLASGFTAAGALSAGPALAQQAPPVVEHATASDAEPLVGGCNGSWPGGYRHVATYWWCADCKAAGRVWESTGEYHAHCQTFGDGIRLLVRSL